MYPWRFWSNYGGKWRARVMPCRRLSSMTNDLKHITLREVEKLMAAAGASVHHEEREGHEDGI